MFRYGRKQSPPKQYLDDRSYLGLGETGVENVQNSFKRFRAPANGRELWQCSAEAVLVTQWPGQVLLSLL